MMKPEQILEEIKFLLEDDTRIVTYKFVSQNFTIHVNTAKQYLSQIYSEFKKSDDDSISAVYFLCGCTGGVDEESSIKVALVTEENLAKCRAQLATLLSCHVYSLQRKTPRNYCAVYGADLQERLLESPPDGSLCGIQGNSSGLRNDNESKAKPVNGASKMASEASGRNTTASTTVNNAPGESVHVKQEPSNGATSNNGKNDCGKRDTDKKGKKKGAIASMFLNARASTKNSSSDNSDKSSVSVKQEVPSPIKQQSSCDASTRACTSACDKQTAHKSSNTTHTNSANSGDTGDDDGARISSQQAAANTAPVTFGKRGAKATKRGASRTKTTVKASTNKRRRIMAIESDSSEDGDNNSDSEHEGSVDQDARAEQPVCVDDVAAESEQDITCTHKKHHRKLVVKTFMDDEGFMVTKKVYESVSDDENTVDTEKEAEKNANSTNSEVVKESIKEDERLSTAKKNNNNNLSTSRKSPAKTSNVATHKTKQANIMNFFKRK